MSFPFPTFVPFSAGGVEPVPAVTFDGTNDFLTRAALVGSAGRRGILSAWFKFSGKDSSLVQIMDVPSGFFVSKTNVNRLQVQGESSANTRLKFTTNSAVTVASGWVHLLASWDLTAGVDHCFLNDVSDHIRVRNTNNNINYTASNCTIGAQTSGALFKFPGDMAEFYLNIAEYLDLSVAANRRKFVTAGGRPAGLGDDGSTPTGNPPAIYLRGPASAFPSNRGTGGNFSVTGALTDSASEPSF